MNINSQKIINWIACAFAAVVMGTFILWIIYFFVDTYLNGFRQDQLLKYQYLGLFNEKYYQKTTGETSWHTRSGEHINFYKNDLSAICVIELSQFNNVIIKDVKIYNYLLKEVNNDFIKSESQLTDNNYPYPHIFSHPMHRHPNQINIYIKSKIEKIIRDEQKVYIKFEKTPFEINSNKQYAEFIFNCISKPSLEVLLLKKVNTTLIIFKYNTDRNKIDQESLLNIIKL